MSVLDENSAAIIPIISQSIAKRLYALINSGARIAEAPSGTIPEHIDKLVEILK